MRIPLHWSVIQIDVKLKHLLWYLSAMMHCAMHIKCALAYCALVLLWIVVQCCNKIKFDEEQGHRSENSDSTMIQFCSMYRSALICYDHRRFIESKSCTNMYPGLKPSISVVCKHTIVSSSRVWSCSIVVSPHTHCHSAWCCVKH